MKRGPHQGEPSILHVTTNTGDRQEFAAVAECFDPEIIDMLAERINSNDLDSAALLDFGVLGLILTGMREFTVISGGETISRNNVSGDRNAIILTTTLDRDADCAERDTLEMAADFEQCVAIALMV